MTYICQTFHIALAGMLIVVTIIQYNAYHVLIMIKGLAVCCRSGVVFQMLLYACKG